MAKKRKKKLKKKVYLYSVILILVAICFIFGAKKYEEYKYKQTYEYKLTEHGYSLGNAKLLLSYYTDKEIETILNIPQNNNIIKLIKEKYYIHKNLERYLTYIENNKETDINDVIAIVNVNRDYEYYEHDINSNISDDKLVIVNKYYTLSETYIPENLVSISNQYAYANNKITEEANNAYVQMWKSAKEAGHQLIVNSSYRDYKDQEDVYESIKLYKGDKEADKVAARPGYSEHQTGLAIDVFEINNQLTGTFKDSPAYTWLKENAHNYGYIERYPEGKEYLTGYSFESWHWRYVGIDAAKIIFEEDITYDEYYAYYIEK